MNLRIFKVAVRAATLFIDLMEIIIDWLEDFDETAEPEGGESA